MSITVEGTDRILDDAISLLHYVIYVRYGTLYETFRSRTTGSRDVVTGLTRGRFPARPEGLSSQVYPLKGVLM